MGEQGSCKTTLHWFLTADFQRGLLNSRWEPKLSLNMAGWRLVGRGRSMMGEGYCSVLQPPFPPCKTESSDSMETDERTIVSCKVKIPQRESPLWVGLREDPGLARVVRAWAAMKGHLSLSQHRRHLGKLQAPSSMRLIYPNAAFCLSKALSWG